MSQLFLKNANLFMDGKFEMGNLLCADGKITACGKDVKNQGAPELDCGGLTLSPGFLDPHTHGGAGVDVNAATPADLDQIAAFFASQGTTGWLASVLTDTEEQTLTCIANICEAMGHTGGAQLLGIHLEGPFLSVEYKGAMPEHLLQKGNVELYHRYQRAAAGAVRYITISPEVDGVTGMIAEIAPEVAVAIGHSAAEYDVAMQAIESGARCATHTFNAMRLFHQHQPAIMGAVLESPAVWCEAICDGRHLHPGTVRMLLQAKGYDKVIAVTDSIMAAGLPDGNYKLGVNDVVVQDGDAKLATTGVRAGSTLTTIQALRNLIKFTGQPLEKLLPLLTANTADALRLQNKGRIAAGKDADFVLLTDDLQIKATVVAGNIVYQQ